VDDDDVDDDDDDDDDEEEVDEDEEEDDDGTSMNGWMIAPHGTPLASNHPVRKIRTQYRSKKEEGRKYPWQWCRLEIDRL